MDEPTMRELMRTKERVQAYSQLVSQRLLEERTAHLQVSEVPYQDVLLECALSKSFRWLRFQQRKSSSTHGSSNSEQTLLGSEFYPGADLLITNLKPGRVPLGPSAVSVLMACDSSTVKDLFVAGASTVTPHKDDPSLASPSFASCISTPEKTAVQVWTTSGLKASSSLRSFYGTLFENSGNTVSGLEVSFQCLIVDWHTVDQLSTGSAATTELKVFAVDAQRMGVVLTYPVPTDLVFRLPWLVKGQLVSVDCALLEHIDGPKDMVQVRRGERTVVTACGGSGTLEQNSSYGVRSYSGHVVSNAVKNSAMKPRVGNPMSGVKRVAFVPPVVTPGTAEEKRSRLQYSSVPPSATKLTSVPALECNLPTLIVPAAAPFALFEVLPWVCEDERRRYASLRRCAQCFEPSRQVGDQEQCDRQVIARATLKYTLTEGPSSCTSENVVIVDAVSRIEREAIVDAGLLAALHIHCGGTAGQPLDPSTELCVVLTQCAHLHASSLTSGDVLAHNESHFDSAGTSVGLKVPTMPSSAALDAMMNALEGNNSVLGENRVAMQKEGNSEGVGDGVGSTLCWKVVWMSPLH